MNALLQQAAEAVAGWLVAASWQLALFIALVAAAAWALRRASPRLRHGLWVLVLLKALLPTTLGGAWAVGSWGVTPVRQTLPAAERVIRAAEAPRPAEAPAAAPAIDVADPAPGPRSPRVTASMVIAAVWLVGAVGFAAAVAVSYARLRRAARALREVDEGPLRIALEEAALAVRFGDAAGVDLRVADRPTGPFLFGVRRPTIVLPAELAEQLEPAELRGVLAHELMHWRRRDTWIGWAQTLVQTLFWFHPLVWWAAARLRDEREKSCDDAVLRGAAGDPSSYGEAIVRSLTIGRGRPIGLTSSPPLVAAGLVGVFERGALLQQRLEDVMNFDPRRGRFGWRSAMFLALFLTVFAPMASRPGAAAAASDASRQGPHPRVVATTPEIGATGVDPGLNEIRVTFDRDMKVGAHSWTGGGEAFPAIDKRRPVRWVDARTCVLPVRLERGRFYRVGINSTSYQNFQSADGQPAEHPVISFATEGAKRSVERRARVPQVVDMSPSNGATNVEPALREISVSFDAPMGEGMSWVRTDGPWPGAEGARARWSRDGRTCTLPVALEPGASYEVGLNGSHYVNFQSKWGAPIAPVAWGFSTASE